MVSFESLLGCDGVCSVPVVAGSLVFWSASGECLRVPASFHSLRAVLSSVSEWAFCRDSLVSVSFWCGSVLVARAWGSWGLSFGCCSVSEAWRAFSFVS